MLTPRQPVARALPVLMLVGGAGVVLRATLPEDVALYLAPALASITVFALFAMILQRQQKERQRKNPQPNPKQPQPSQQNPQHQNPQPNAGQAPPAPGERPREPQPRREGMNRAQAEQILDALQELQRMDQQRQRKVRVLKERRGRDW